MATFKVPAPAPAAAPFEFSVPRPRRWYEWLAPWHTPRTKYSMPIVDNLEPELLVAVAGSVAGVTAETLTENSAKIIWETQLAVIDHYAPGARDGLTNQQLSAIFGAYYEQSNSTLGESSASPSS